VWVAVAYGEQAEFSKKFTRNGLGGSAMMGKLTAFQRICDWEEGLIFLKTKQKKSRPLPRFFCIFNISN
jgi:hypothetical protein